MRHSRPEFNLILKDNQLTELRIALLVANWNIDYNQEMANSARETLVEKGVKSENISFLYVPGAFEIPFVSQRLFEAGNGSGIAFDAVICFATVIRGETYHFEIVANESARGIMDVMLKFSKPIINGILTVNTEEQALSRASKQQDDKGKELALSCLQVLSYIS